MSVKNREELSEKSNLEKKEKDQKSGREYEINLAIELECFGCFTTRSISSSLFASSSKGHYKLAAPSWVRIKLFSKPS